MTGKHNVHFMLFLLICIGFAPRASGMIVAGANGGADNTHNTTRQQLEALPGVSDGHFFENVFRMGGGNAVYIGFRNTAGGPVGYALSGMHIGGQSSLNIQSVSYSVENRVAIDESDLALFSFTHPDNTMPTLQPIQLANDPMGNNTPVIMIGEGRNRVQNATTDANTSDAVAVNDGTGYTTTSTRLKRWGTNETSNFTDGTSSFPLGIASLDAPDDPNISSRDTIVFRTVFNEPSDGEWLTTSQAQGVRGDSGGGVFAFDGSLLGIMVAIQGPTNTEARFGNTTLMADIATYRDDIDSITGGILIPEPGALVLAGIALTACGLGLGTRRRHKRAKPRVR